MIAHCTLSNTIPIIHGHDRCRDNLIDLRRTAADSIWTDQEKFGNYKASADAIESSKSEWWNSDIWTRNISPFDSFLPDFAKPLIGETSYKVRWELLS